MNSSQTQPKEPIGSPQLYLPKFPVLLPPNGDITTTKDREEREITSTNHTHFIHILLLLCLLFTQSFERWKRSSSLKVLSEDPIPLLGGFEDEKKLEREERER